MNVEDDEALELINRIITVLNDSRASNEVQYTAIQRVRLHLEKHLQESFDIDESGGKEKQARRFVVRPIQKKGRASSCAGDRGC